MASTPPRRCRKCRMPMKGHRAETCIAIQEAAAAPVTPPASPPNIIASHNRTRNEVEIPVERHWRDPSWVPRANLPSAAVLPCHNSDGPSLIPTVLVDEDGNTILGSHDRRVPASEASDDASSDHPNTFIHLSRPKTPMAQVMDQAHALQLCDPVLSIVKVSIADLPRMQATAGQSGLCTSIVRQPWAAPRFKDEFEPTVNWEDERKIWVVVGGDPGLVQRTADLQQHYEKVPGAEGADLVVVQATYKHIFLTSIVSAFLALAAVSMLL
ncbi:hypothetical protein C8R43DRAFT_95503 [Mycena crocata]|nr:hypothetical protein C8R43DRAFT_95503 [Mycena crocata]